MTTTPLRDPAQASPAQLEALYATMLRIRLVEDAVFRLFQSGQIEGTTHLCQGQEAVAVGVCDVLESVDRIAATYRGHGAALACGVDPFELFAEILGRASGTNGGRGGSMNVIALDRGLLGCFGIVGGSIAAATGAALAFRLQGANAVAVAFFGDGAANQAYFHECLNFAGVRCLPVVFVCENNLYGEWTPLAASTAGGRIAHRASAYGISGVEVDGNDVLAVREAAHTSVARARRGGGPTLLEAKTYRHKGHSRIDPGKYRPQTEVDEWLARDPLPRLAAQLNQSDVDRLTSEVAAEVERALTRALGEPLPSAASPASACTTTTS